MPRTSAAGSDPPYQRALGHMTPSVLPESQTGSARESPAGVSGGFSDSRGLCGGEGGGRSCPPAGVGRVPWPSGGEWSCSSHSLRLTSLLFSAPLLRHPTRQGLHSPGACSSNAPASRLPCAFSARRRRRRFTRRLSSGLLTSHLPPSAFLFFVLVCLCS